MDRRLLVVLGVVVAAAVALVVVVAGGNRVDEEALRRVGAGLGSCGGIVDVPPTGASDHRQGTIEYDRSPPNSGPHAPNWVRVGDRRFAPGDAPPVEQVVHNLEHGYVVVWYNPTAPDLALLDEALAAADTRKLFAMPWAEGGMSARYMLTAWGHEQPCNGVSGEAIADFIKAYGGSNGDAPEPDAP